LFEPTCSAWLGSLTPETFSFPFDQASFAILLAE